MSELVAVAVSAPGASSRWQHSMGVIPSGLLKLELSAIFELKPRSKPIDSARPTKAIGSWRLHVVRRVLADRDVSIVLYSNDRDSEPLELDLSNAVEALVAKAAR